MTIEMEQPGVTELSEVVEALSEWQDDTAPLQLHPGDLGWFWRNGPEATAAAVRTWRRDGVLRAIGLLDGPDLLRLAIAPDAGRDDELAMQLVADVVRPAGGVLPAGEVTVESPNGSLVHDLLGEHGWGTDEPWTLLRRDLALPVDDVGVRVDAVGTELAHDFTEVHRSAFASPAATDERWRTMAVGLPFAAATCLVARDSSGAPVASVIVWAAGPGRPGVIEPMGVHREHRGHGYGRAITIAGATALRAMGSSSALVATPSANVGAVATYRSAGFDLLPERRDRIRSA